MHDQVMSRTQRLLETLQSRGETLCIAESCTGGLLSSWLTQLPGVSSIYRGTVVSYHAEVKHRVLGVSPVSIRTYGEVSEPVARQMAAGARRVMNATWAVSITGIAGPSGGSVEKPVGTVYFGLLGPGIDRVEWRRFAPGAREEIQSQAALFAFDFLLSEL